jgi:hypothetical protein
MSRRAERFWWADSATPTPIVSLRRIGVGVAAGTDTGQGVEGAFDIVPFSRKTPPQSKDMPGKRR